jgi:KUP system potassium uptake protein
VEDFLQNLEKDQTPRVKGTAVFLTGNTEGVPPALLFQLAHNKVLHDRVLFLTVITDDVPRVWRWKEVEVEELGQNFFRVIAHHGFMEPLNMDQIFRRLGWEGLKMDMKETSFFLGRENVVPVKEVGLPLWRSKIFYFMTRNAMPITSYLKIPLDRIIELGIFVKV